MGFFSRKATVLAVSEKNTSPSSPESQSPQGSIHKQPNGPIDPREEGRVTFIAVLLGAISSIGGFMFGYESGQISGFLAMSNFLDRFGQDGKFSAARQGTIVGFLCIGTLIGCLFSGWLADKIGRRLTISASAFFYIIGVIIEITSSTVWVQFAMGRLVAGLGIGALSTSVPMLQSESVPKRIRGPTVASYQLLITIGIWTAYMVNYATEAKYKNSAQWRIPNGLSALWAIILGTSILFMPESPRYAYRNGRKEEARKVLARLNGVDPNGALIEAEIAEIEEKLAAELVGGDHPLSEIFTGPRMFYRTLLGMTLQAGQQLTGANFFFYFGTTIFKSTGISNSYVTSIILGSVNVGATIVGLWIVKNVGRRKALMWGAAVMFVCFLIYSLVGSLDLSLADPESTPIPGKVLIVFTCIFIAAFATTWGPLVWTIVSELYPARYRAPCMALATSSNWLFNFLISFFTTFITNKIHYWYGMVFGACCLALFFIVYFFVIESKDRSLEEIDTMYVLGVSPIESAKWRSSDLGNEGMTGTNTDNLHLATRGRDVKKTRGAGELLVHGERKFPENPAAAKPENTETPAEIVEIKFFDNNGSECPREKKGV